MTTTDLPSRYVDAANRIPRSMDDLRGPKQGMVVLPPHLAWSGHNDFSIDDPRERLTLYRIRLDCGQRDAVNRYVDADLLRADWPRIRRLTSRQLISVWESCLPDLAAA